MDVACIRIEAIGEAVKKIEKRSEGKLLKKYPVIPWKKIMGVRDVIAHHYFEVDINVVFDIIKNDLKPLLKVVRQIKKEL